MTTLVLLEIRSKRDWSHGVFSTFLVLLLTFQQVDFFPIFFFERLRFFSCVFLKYFNQWRMFSFRTKDRCQQWHANVIKELSWISSFRHQHIVVTTDLLSFCVSHVLQKNTVLLWLMFEASGHGLDYSQCFKYFVIYVKVCYATYNDNEQTIVLTTWDKSSAIWSYQELQPFSLPITFCCIIELGGLHSLFLKTHILVVLVGSPRFFIAKCQ